MKIVQLIFNFLFAAIGIILLINRGLSKEVIPVLIFVLIIYGFLVLLFSIIKEIYYKSFPWNLLLFLLYGFIMFQVFAVGKPIIDKEQLIASLKIISSFLAIYYCIDNIFKLKANSNINRIKPGAFLKYFFINYLIISIILLFLLIFYNFSKQNIPNIFNYYFVVLVLSFPIINQNFIRKFAAKILKQCSDAGLDITFTQFSKLARIRNFVFAKDKFISTDNFKIVDTDYRTTVKIITVMQLAYQLANDWNKKYTKLFVLDEYEKNPLKYDIVEKNENGISVIDDNAVMYHFGNNSFMKDKIKKDETCNLYLVKNELTIAKFKINEKIEDVKAEFINNLDYFGTTILFFQGLKEDLGKDYSLVFDKIYPIVTEKRQNELLAELEKKAPTVYIAAKEPGSIPNSLFFYITTNTDARPNEKQIVCNSENILGIPHMINISRKIHAYLKRFLISSILVQILFILASIMNFKYLIPILGIYLFIILLADIYSLFLKKKLTIDQTSPLV